MKKQTSQRKKVCSINNKDVKEYLNLVLKDKIPTSKEVRQQCSLVKEILESGTVTIDNKLYERYLKIGYLFFKDIFLWQKFATAIYLCTFYKNTDRPRWNKILIVVGRGNGKDGMIAWWSACLTSEYHKVQHYDIDIIANNMDQSLRPINDINYMSKDLGKEDFYEKIGDSIISYATDSFITARSSDAKMQDGLRSGAIVFNEVHGFADYSRLNVMVSGLGKIEDPRQMYLTTNGDVRGGVLDDMLDTAKDVLDKVNDDKRFLYLIYKLDDKSEATNTDLWVKANPSLSYRETLKDQIVDEFDTWSKNPDNMPAFLQKRMNLPEMPSDQEVVPWEVILKTNQQYDYRNLVGMNCVLGIDFSRTTDWTAFNLLFYDSEAEKFICINHSFICARNRDLSGIKAPYMDWCEKGLCTLIDEKEVDPEYVLNYVFDFAKENGYNISHVVIDDFKKNMLQDSLDRYGYNKDLENLSIIRPSNIASTIPIIERAFLNEMFIWGDNPVLRWATNNTKVIPWKNTKTTGDNDLGNQLYAKINRRFRKTDPFMALVHSMIKSNVLKEEYVDVDDLTLRGFK